jgi:hypothetical protein
VFAFLKEHDIGQVGLPLYLMREGGGGARARGWTFFQPGGWQLAGQPLALWNARCCAHISGDLANVNPFQSRNT